MLGWRKSETIGRVALVGTAILGLGRVAIAEPESVRIDYAAPTGCPDATAFVRSLRERTTRFREAAPDGASAEVPRACAGGGLRVLRPARDP